MEPPDYTFCGDVSLRKRQRFAPMFQVIAGGCGLRAWYQPGGRGLSSTSFSQAQVTYRPHLGASEALATVSVNLHEASLTATVSARRSDSGGSGTFLRAELPCAPTYSERLVYPCRSPHSRKDHPTDRENYISALAEDVLGLSLPRDLPVQITAHGAMTDAKGFNVKNGFLGHQWWRVPDAPVMFLNALGVALAGADLPLRGGMLGAVTVMKMGDAGGIKVNPSPQDLKTASATLLYAACPSAPLLVLLDSSRGLNGKSRAHVVSPETVSEMLDAAETAMETEFKAQRTAIMHMKHAQALSLTGEGSGSFQLPIMNSNPEEVLVSAKAETQQDKGDTSHHTLAVLAERPQWPTLEASPTVQHAARHAAQPYMHALLEQPHLSRSKQIQVLAKMEAAVREDLHMRGILRNNLGSSSDSSSLTQHMVPGTFHKVLCQMISERVLDEGKRGCRVHGVAEARTLGGEMLSRNCANGMHDGDALQSVNAAASAVVWTDATQIYATASLPSTSRPHYAESFMSPYQYLPERTKVALGTPMHARHAGDYRRDLYHSCLLEQALAATGDRNIVPMRIQIERMSDDGSCMSAALHAAWLARRNLGLPAPPFASLDVAGFLGTDRKNPEDQSQSMQMVLDPNALEESTCTLHATCVVLPSPPGLQYDEHTSSSQESRRQVAWSLVRLPQSGATRHDVMHALEFAAAHSAQRESEWAQMRLPRSPVYVADLSADEVTETASPESPMHAQEEISMHVDPSEASLQSAAAQNTLESKSESEIETECDEAETALSNAAAKLSYDVSDSKVTTSDLAGDDDVSDMQDSADSQLFVPTGNYDDAQSLAAYLPLGKKVSAPIGTMVTRRFPKSDFARFMSHSMGSSIQRMQEQDGCCILLAPDDNLLCVWAPNTLQQRTADAQKVPQSVLQKLMRLVSITRTPNTPIATPLTPPVATPAQQGHSRPHAQAKSHITGGAASSSTQHPKNPPKGENTVTSASGGSYTGTHSPLRHDDGEVTSSMTDDRSNSSMHERDGQNSEDSMHAHSADTDDATDSLSISEDSRSSTEGVSSKGDASGGESSQQLPEDSISESSVIPPWKAASDAVASGVPLNMTDTKRPKTRSKSDQTRKERVSSKKYQDDRTAGESSRRDSHREERSSHSGRAPRVVRHPEGGRRSRGRGRNSSRHSSTDNSNSNFSRSPYYSASSKRPTRDADSLIHSPPGRRGRGRGDPGRGGRGGRGAGGNVMHERKSEPVPDVLAGSGGKFQISTSDIVG